LLEKQELLVVENTGKIMTVKDVENWVAQLTVTSNNLYYRKL